MITDTTAPHAWIGCLACYNDGRLVGQWFDATEAADVTPDDIHEGHTGHEELWVFDHENFHGALQGECSPIEAARIAKAVESAMQSVGADIGAVAAFIANDSSVLDSDTFADDFADAYAGRWDSVADFVAEYTDETGGLHRVPDSLTRYIDWDAMGRDWVLGGDIWTAQAADGVYVFHAA